MMLVENKYNFGDIVYLKTDKEQLPRMVVQITLRPGSILYELSCGSVSSWHYEFEVSAEIDILKTTND